MTPIIKQSMICSKITEYTIDSTKNRAHIPSPGDVGIFEVISLGKHTRIQDCSRRNVHIFPGDRIMAAFGNRYATNQIEGYIPTENHEAFHILGQGGVVGIVKSSHSKMPNPTMIRLAGYAVQADGTVINTRYYRSEKHCFTGSVPSKAKVILSVGTSMDSGKTTTAGYLVRSLKNIGKKVAYVKLTGTAYSKDRDFCFDCGADYASDFSDAGFPSTFLCDKKTLLDLYQTMLETAASVQPNYIIVEIADGLYQRETRMLLNDPAFMSTVHTVLFSCVDSLSAVNGANYLKEIGKPPAAVCGTFTMSPLLIEEVKAACGIKTATLKEMLTPDFAGYVDALVPLGVGSP